MNLIIGIYIAITMAVFIMGIFAKFDKLDFIKALLWPIWLIKIILKELFKLLFTNWK